MSALKFVGKHMKRHKGKIIISLVLSIVISLVSSLGPYIMKLIVDVGIPEGRIEYILILSSMAVAVYFLYSMGNFLLSYIFTLLSETVNLDIKKEIYNKLMYYPLSFFGNKEKGYILARTNEINSIKPLFSSTTCKLGLSIIEFVIASVFLFSINTSFTICIYLFLPIYFLLIKMMMNKTRYIVGKNMEEVATANGTIQQVLSGIEQVKISNKEKTESQKINNLNERISKLSTKQSVLLNLTSESIMLICNIISVLVLVISAIHISKNNMTMGDYFAFSGYLPKLLAPVQALASSLISIQPAIASLKRLVQYFSEKIEVENDLPYLNISNGQIVLGNITDNTLHEILSKDDLYSYWTYSKDKVVYCKNCSMRYFCSDCSVFELASHESSNVHNMFCPANIEEKASDISNVEFVGWNKEYLSLDY